MEIENLHKALPEKFAVEIGDLSQFFLRSMADQQMRFVIYFSQQLDFNLLKKAVRLSIYEEPIFSYIFKEDNNSAYWQKQNDIDSLLLADLVETVDDKSIEINKFINATVSPFEFPLVRIKIIRSNGKDVLCINMNHTPTDGAGLKRFAGILSNNYNKLLADPGYTCHSNIKGDRSIKQVTDHFTFFQKIRFVKQGFKKPKMRLPWSFNWEKTDNDNQNQFATAKISADTFERIKAIGKQHNATINDVVITAFIRVFVNTKPDNDKVSKPLIIPVDLRKYLDSGHNTAICSLIGTMIVNIGYEIGSSFLETLNKVVRETSYKKEIHAEMHMLSPLLLLSKFVPYRKLKEQTMGRKIPPIPLITNIGIIKPGDINFNNIPVEYSYITGAISYGDYFGMGYSTFNKEITFSIGFKGGDLQLQKVNRFLTDFKTELENIE